MAELAGKTYELVTRVTQWACMVWSSWLRTLRAYRSDLVDCALWVTQEGRSWRDPEAIADYMRFLETGSSYATITRRLTAIHKLLEIEALTAKSDVFEDPTKHPVVSVTLQAIDSASEPTRIKRVRSPLHGSYRYSCAASRN